MTIRDLTPSGGGLRLVAREDRTNVSYSTAIQGTIEFNKKVIEIAQSNVNAAFASGNGRCKITCRVYSDLHSADEPTISSHHATDKGTCRTRPKSSA
jgi:hypothetical protein